MNSRLGGLPIVIGLAFVSVFLLLLWLVPRLFQAYKLQDLGTPARPIEVRSRIKSRLIGLAFMLAGLGVMYWSWHDARKERFFSVKLAVMGPAVFGLGFYMLIEGPELPIQRGTPFGWVCTVTGLVSGFVYMEFLRTGRIPFLP